MDRVVCPKCGNNKFSQISLYNVKEIISLEISSEKIFVKAESIDSIDEGKIEHLNEFECLKCKMRYEIINKNGKEYLGDDN